jgi:hypothetical protein
VEIIDQIIRLLLIEKEGSKLLPELPDQHTNGIGGEA